jgi:RimJ/RimL family protein N-acetyltransferase
MEFLVADRLETNRLVLRMFRDGDWRDLHEYYGDSECMRYTLKKAHTEAETWRVMASLVGHWHLRGYGPYAVEEKASGTVLGIVGLWYPMGWPEPEIAWGLARRHWGRGFAREAARAVHHMALHCLPDVALISFIDALNTASIHLAKALGAVYEKTVAFRGESWVVYRHCRHEYPNRTVFGDTGPCSGSSH